ncbi:MAG: L-rhamnonate dehydratase, partial [Planctomycetes bacterium]|nr:L-rhamnonate dehydratase [Planctomycetota bacterium]
MKITDIRAVQPVAPDSPADWRTSIGQILVAVETDAGLTGYGVGGGGLSGIHVIRTVLRDLLLGKNPEQTEQLWESMCEATLA